MAIGKKLFKVSRELLTKTNGFRKQDKNVSMQEATNFPLHDQEL